MGDVPVIQHYYIYILGLVYLYDAFNSSISVSIFLNNMLFLWFAILLLFTKKQESS